MESSRCSRRLRSRDLDAACHQPRPTAGRKRRDIPRLRFERRRSLVRRARGGRDRRADPRRVELRWEPAAVIRVGPGAGETMRFDQAPPRDADGRITPDGALWSFRQGVTSPVRREAVRGMPYVEYSKSAGSYTTIIPLDLVVYVMVIEVEEPVLFTRGGVSCRELFAFVRSDGRGEGSGGGCMGNTWPTDRLPPAFATP